MITLETLAKASNQEIFDQVADHLLIQNAKSEVSDACHSCLYRFGTLKCAAGAIIADDEYTDDMEGKIIGSIILDTCNTKGWPTPQGTQLDLLRALQLVHDVAEVKDWPEALDSVAGEFGLQFKR